MMLTSNTHLKQNRIQEKTNAAHLIFNYLCALWFLCKNNLSPGSAGKWSEKRRGKNYKNLIRRIEFANEDIRRRMEML